MRFREVYLSRDSEIDNRVFYENVMGNIFNNVSSNSLRNFYDFRLDENDIYWDRKDKLRYSHKYSIVNRGISRLFVREMAGIINLFKMYEIYEFNIENEV